MLRDELLELRKHLAESTSNTLDFQVGESVQFTARENFKFPGSKIFVRDDGKVGFPTINSVEFNVGDIIRGVVRKDSETYFFVEVREVI